MNLTMISKRILQYLSIIALLLFTLQLSAQDAPIVIEVEMRDGTTIIGSLIEDNETHLILNSTTIGRISIDKLKIKSYYALRENLQPKENGWLENPNATRNVFSPTGYGLRKNEGYYQNFMLGINQVSYGFTDHFTIGLTLEGFSTIAAINGIGSPAFAITPKFSIPVKKDIYNIGLGAMIVNLPHTGQLFDWNLFYVVNTLGSRDRNISLGVAYGLKEGTLADRPTFTLSGAFRVSQQISLITENWFIPEAGSTQAFNLLGIRITGKKVSWDISLIGTKLDNGFLKSRSSYFILPLPIAGVTIPFGKGWTR